MTTKICCKCKEEKSTDEFTKLSNSPDGLNYYCKLCSRNITKQWKKNNSEKIKIWRMDNKISACISASKRNCKIHGWVAPNFDVATVEEAAINQQGMCAACKQPFGDKSYFIDHDHRNGNFRGLLCISCNLAEGFFRTSERCLLMADYLKKFE